MQNKYKVKKISLKRKYLEIYWHDKHISKFHFLWLRDNCPTAFHKYTRMRSFNILSVSKKIRPIKYNFSSKNISINWSENNHYSTYNLKWLRDNCYSEINSRGHISPYRLWSKKIFLI